MAKTKTIIGSILMLLIGLGIIYFVWIEYTKPDIEVALPDDDDTDDTDLDDIKPLLDLDKDYVPKAPEDSSVLPVSSDNTEMTRLWNTKGTDTKDEMSIWRPSKVPGYSSVGDMISLDEKNFEPTQTIFYVNDDAKFSALPINYTKVWETDGSIDAKEDMTIWEPVCPNDYVPMGHVIGEKKGLPARDTVRCAHKDLVQTLDNGTSKIWNSKKGHDKKSKLDPVRVYRVFGTNTFVSSVGQDEGEIQPVNAFKLT